MDSYFAGRRIVNANYKVQQMASSFASILPGSTPIDAFKSVIGPKNIIAVIKGNVFGTSCVYVYR
jgi:hypothetical protein